MNVLILGYRLGLWLGVLLGSDLTGLDMGRQPLTDYKPSLVHRVIQPVLKTLY